MSNSDPNQALLRKLLRLNGVFSTVSALGLLAFAGRIYAPLGLPAPELLTSTAVSLLVFAVVLFVSAFPERIPLGPVWGIIALDFLWVLYSGAALVMPAEPMSTGGAVGILGVAVVVGSFGFLQLRSARRVRSDRRTAGGGATTGLA